MTEQSAERVPKPDIVFLLDVDNTLLDNDRLKQELAARLREMLGSERADLFWRLYEQVRQEQDFVDYPTTIRRFCGEIGDPDMAARLESVMDQIPFRSYLYPHVLDTIDHLNTLGTVVILSDGDSVFQPLKIKKSGLADAVGGRVLVYVHKEHELSAVFALYPAGHYVVVDDKGRILSALERDCPTEFTTIQVLQGHYGRPGGFSPGPDYVIENFGDLRHFTRDRFLGPGRISTRSDAQQPQ